MVGAPQHLRDEEAQGDAHPPPEAGHEAEQATYGERAVPALRQAEEDGDAGLEEGDGDGGGLPLLLLLLDLAAGVGMAVDDGGGGGDGAAVAGVRPR